MEDTDAMKAVKTHYGLYGATAATAFAAELLQSRQLTTFEYIDLVRWSEGR